MTKLAPEELAGGVGSSAVDGASSPDIVGGISIPCFSSSDRARFIDLNTGLSNRRASGDPASGKEISSHWIFLMASADSLYFFAGKVCRRGEWTGEVPAHVRPVAPWAPPRPAHRPARRLPAALQRLDIPHSTYVSCGFRATLAYGVWRVVSCLLNPCGGDGSVGRAL